MILHDWACLCNLVSPWYFPFMTPTRSSHESATFPTRQTMKWSLGLSFYRPSVPLIPFLSRWLTMCSLSLSCGVVRCTRQWGWSFQSKNILPHRQRSEILQFYIDWKPFPNTVICYGSLSGTVIHHYWSSVDSRLTVFFPIPRARPLEVMWKVTLISALCSSQLGEAVLCLKSSPKKCYISL